MLGYGSVEHQLSLAVYPIFFCDFCFLLHPNGVNRNGISEASTVQGGPLLVIISKVITPINGLVTG